MGPVPHCAMQWLQNELDEFPEGAQYVLDPTAMIAEIQAYAAISAIASGTAPPSAFPTATFAEDIPETYEPLFTDALRDVNQMVAAAAKGLLEKLLVRSRGNPRARVGPAAKDALRGALRRFMECPTELNARAFPLCHALPDIYTHWRGIHERYRSHRAKMVMSACLAPLLLRTDVARPEGTEALIPGRLELWMHVASDIDDEHPDILVLSASLIHVNEAHPTELVGSLFGYFVGTQKDIRGLPDQGRRDIFDNHDPALATAWSELHDVVLPSLGLHSLAALGMRLGETPSMGIVVPHVRLAEKFHTPLLAQVLFDAVAKASVTAGEHASDHVGSTGGMVDAAPIGAERIAHRLRSNPIRVFLPIDEPAAPLHLLTNTVVYNSNAKDAPSYLLHARPPTTSSSISYLDQRRQGPAQSRIH